MAAKYWPRKSATDEASVSWDAPAPTVTAPAPEESGEVSDGPCAGAVPPGPAAEESWPTAEAPCAGWVDWAWFRAASACDG